MEEFKDYRMKGWKDSFITGCKDGRINELLDVEMEEFMDYLMEGWKNSWITG